MYIYGRRKIIRYLRFLSFNWQLTLLVTYILQQLKLKKKKKKNIKPVHRCF